MYCSTHPALMPTIHAKTVVLMIVLFHWSRADQNVGCKNEATIHKPRLYDRIMSMINTTNTSRLRDYFRDVVLPPPWFYARPFINPWISPSSYPYSSSWLDYPWIVGSRAQPWDTALLEIQKRTWLKNPPKPVLVPPMPRPTAA